jgi:hypothetical protein
MARAHREAPDLALAVVISGAELDVTDDQITFTGYDDLAKIDVILDRGLRVVRLTKESKQNRTAVTGETLNRDRTQARQARRHL